MCFKRKGAISTLSGGPLELVDKLTYLSSNISSTESDVKIHLEMATTDVDRLSIIWKSDTSDKIKRDFFHAGAVLVLLYGYTTRKPRKRQVEKARWELHENIM